MSFDFTYQSQLTFLDSAIEAADLHIHLYSNDATISPTMVLGGFTESSFGSYVHQTLDKDDWSLAETVLGVAVKSYSTTITWTNTGVAANVYGFFVTDSTDAILYWAEEFDAGVKSLGTGQSLDVTVRVQLQGDT